MAKKKEKVGELREHAVPGESPAQGLARTYIAGDAVNAITALNYGNALFNGKLELTECVQALRTQIEKVKEGDLSQVEAMLMGQATALASIFSECARRAAINMGGYPEAMERYMRLALKAQSQCRTTLEALVEAKYPRSVAFVRQANIAHGHQQVNNGLAETVPGTHEKTRNEPNELLEAGNVVRLDAGAQGKTSGSYPTLEAVGAVNRA